MNDQQWENKFAELARASGMNQLPETLRAKLMDAFRHHQRTRPSRLRQFLCTLSFDSFTQPLPQGARKAELGSSNASTPRQLFYFCELGDITLDLAPQADKYILTGQLFFSNSNTPYEVRVVRQGEMIASVMTSKHNLFRVPISVGRADLVLSNAENNITLKNVPLELSRD